MRLSSATDKIPWARPNIDSAELNQVVSCFKSGWFTAGPKVEQFEHEMAARAQRKHGIAVANGTAALDLALRVLGVKHGDEVVVPALSYVATASTVLYTSATPVFADVDRRNLGLDPVAASAAITPMTRAVMCTDHGGNPCDYDALEALCGRHGLPLIVDGAQSLGSIFNGRPTLSRGVISTTSFHAAKTMTTIEGGMVFTDDDAIARRVRIMRSQGEDPERKYHHIELGHNFRMTELQAAIGLAQLTKLDRMLADRASLARRYAAECQAIGVVSPAGLPGATNANFLFTMLVPRRDSVRQIMGKSGIETRVCYPLTLYQQPIFQHMKHARCPVAEWAANSILNPPLFFGLTAAQYRRVVEQTAAAIRATGGAETMQYREAV